MSMQASVPRHPRPFRLGHVVIGVVVVAFIAVLAFQGKHLSGTDATSASIGSTGLFASTVMQSPAMDFVVIEDENLPDGLTLIKSEDEESVLKKMRHATTSLLYEHDVGAVGSGVPRHINTRAYGSLSRSSVGSTPYIHGPVGDLIAVRTANSKDGPFIYWLVKQQDVALAGQYERFRQICTAKATSVASHDAVQFGCAPL